MASIHFDLHNIYCSFVEYFVTVLPTIFRKKLHHVVRFLVHHFAKKVLVGDVANVIGTAIVADITIVAHGKKVTLRDCVGIVFCVGGQAL